MSIVARPRQVIAFLLLLTSQSAVATGSIPIMTVDQIKPGMKGTGLSVFSGTQVKEFGVEVIDVMHKAWPRGDLIICRLSGQGLEESEVVEGMSGSPVYIDGRLIGAVAYGWGFSKEPIAGVTPAAQMLRIWKETDRTAGPTGAPSGSLPEGSAPTGLSPLPLPVAMSGYTPALAELIGPALSKFGLTPVAAAGAAPSGTADTSGLVPGAAVGVALIDGDVRVSAMGTLTCRDGNRILAFGHPMLGAGNVRMPMVGGIIHTVVSSEASSFKLFSPTAPLGTINQDRLPGVGGAIGTVPEMLPVTAVLSSPSGLDTYRFRIVELENLVPTLAAMGLTDVVYQTEGNLEEMTLASRMTVHLRIHQPDTPRAAVRHSAFELRTSQADSLVVEHRFSGANPAAALFRSSQNELGDLFGNRFLPSPVASVDFNLSFSPGQRLAYLLSARADRLRVRPGDSVRITLGLRDYRGNDSEMTAAIAIPEATPEGKLRIIIAPPDSLLALEAMRAPATLEPKSFARLVELLSQTGRENDLVAAGFTAKPGLTLADEELSTPPPSLRSVLLNRRSDEPVTSTSDSPVFRQTLRLDRVVSGVVKLDLEVKR